MPSTTRRRPLPALVFLLALTLLTALVWWRVLNRGTGSTSGSPCPRTSSTSPSATTLPTPSSVTVVVLNSTDRSGIAGKTRTLLMRDGFQIPAAASNDAKNVHVRGVAEIRYAPAQLRSATLLAYYFPTARLRQVATAGNEVVVSLGAKFRRVATQAEVRAALARDGITLKPAQNTLPSPSGSPSC